MYLHRDIQFVKIYTLSMLEREREDSTLFNTSWDSKVKKSGKGLTPYVGELPSTVPVTQNTKYAK